MSLLADLKATRRWIEINTYCALQRRDGWYVDDCVESHQRRKCERCKILARLDRQIRAFETAHLRAAAPVVKHGVGRVVRVEKRPPLVIPDD